MTTATAPELLNNPASWATTTAERTLTALQAFLPDLLLAVILLFLGWLGAWLVRLIILRFGRGLDRLLTTLHQDSPESVSRSNWSITVVVGNLAFWIIITISLVSASNALGLVLLANWLQDLLSYLPRLLISAAILFIGNLISQGLRDLIRGYAEARDIQHGPLMGQMVAGLIIAFSLLLALDQVGLDVGLLENIIILAFAAFFGGTAIAFGLGAADSVRNIMASHYLRRQFQPGLLVRIGEQEGEILELTPVAVLLDTENGQTLIPARHFMENASIILTPEDIDGS